jgi:hypothetical protein
LSDLPLKNKSSPLSVLTASKDKAGSHLAGVPGPGERDVLGTIESSTEEGGGPKGNRLGEANVRRNANFYTFQIFLRCFEMKLYVLFQNFPEDITVLFQRTLVNNRHSFHHHSP